MKEYRYPQIHKIGNQVHFAPTKNLFPLGPLKFMIKTKLSIGYLARIRAIVTLVPLILCMTNDTLV